MSRNVIRLYQELTLGFRKGLALLRSIRKKYSSMIIEIPDMKESPVGDPVGGRITLLPLLL